MAVTQHRSNTRLANKSLHTWVTSTEDKCYLKEGHTWT